MQDPQVNLKGRIVRVNLDSGKESSGLGLGTWFCVARGFMCWENTCEAFIRLEKLHCNVAYR